MAEQVWNERPPGSNQFPSKYEQLPHIGGESPRPGSGNQIVPLRAQRKGSPGNFGHRSASMDQDTEERIRQLEMRLGVSEKSNRALLEEVLRLQNDLRNTTRRSEDVLREERESRQQLSEAIRISNELISQLSVRIKETEEKIEEEKSSLNVLFSHTKNVEKTVVQSQHDLQQRRDAQSMKLQELRAELGETKASRGQLEQLTYTLSEELRSLRSRVEQQQAEFSNMIGEVRSRARKLEEDNKIHLDSMRKQSDLHNMSDISQSQLRGQVENRLSELRDVLMDLRGKHEAEQNDRRNLEKAMQSKISELGNQLSEQSRKREEGMHTVDMVLREKDHALQAERLQLNAKVTDTVEDVNKRLLSKEMKLREEIQSKFLQLEKLVQREQQTRQDYEKGSREDGDRKWQALKKLLEEEMSVLKESLSNERNKNRDAISKLDQSISIVEKQLAENKKQVDKILTAEIKSRKIHEGGTDDKISSVNEKLQLATSSLQQAIGGVSQNLQSNNEKLRRELKQMLNEQQQGSTRALSDMDAKLTTVKQRIVNMEDMLDAKVASASQGLSERLTERIETITKWQDSTGDTLRELGRSIQTMPQEIYEMEEKMKLMKSEMDSRLSHENDSRTKEMEEMRSEIQALKSRLDRQPKPPSRQEMEATNVGVRKLADNLQTVKTVLGMKIQSEQKLRMTGLEDLQSQINQLKVMTGSSLKFQPSYRSQMDELDTGLGWDDLGTLGTNTGTPSTSYGADKSRNNMHDPSKNAQPVIQEEREDSPFETKGGLKNMNAPSPTPKAGTDQTVPKSPAFAQNPAARNTPGNVTPDDWRTPRDGNKTPDNAGKKSSLSNKGGTKTPGNQTPGNHTPGNRTPVNQSPGNRTPGNQSPGNRTPGNRTPGNRTPNNRSAGRKTPGNASQNAPNENNQGNNTDRNLDSGLKEV